MMWLLLFKIDIFFNEISHDYGILSFEFLFKVFTYILLYKNILPLKILLYYYFLLTLLRELKEQSTNEKKKFITRIYI